MNRAGLRRLRFGLATLLGLRRRGFFIPYRYAAGVVSTSYPELEALFREREAAFRDWLAVIDGHAADLLRIGDAPPPAPRWRQDWFPRLDAAVAYAMVRRFRPARIVEVGSGHSTRFLARAVADEGLETRITAIDPTPRTDLAGLAGVEVVRRTLQEVLPAPPPRPSPTEGGGRSDGTAFPSPSPLVGEGWGGGKPLAQLVDLRPDDILFIDSSHILMPGTDVDLLLNRVIPTLPAGVLIHVHDVFLPDGYPPVWDWRGYNEQLGIMALLTSGGFDLLFASRYAATRLGGAVAASVLARLPLPTGAFESSLWLRKR